MDMLASCEILIVLIAAGVDLNQPCSTHFVSHVSPWAHMCEIAQQYILTGSFSTFCGSQMSQQIVTGPHTGSISMTIMGVESTTMSCHT